MMQQFPSAVLDAARDTQGGSSTNPSGANTPSLDIASLTTQLTNLGFRPAHIASALSALSSASARLNSSSNATSDPLVLSLTILSPLEAAIEWLLLHLPEDDLPQRYRTSTSSSDFVVGASKQGGLVKGWLADKLVKQAGFPRKAVEAVLATEEASESAILEVLGRKLCGWLGEDEGWGVDAVIAWQGGDDELAERAMAREEELLAVEAVLGERYRKESADLAIDLSDEISGDTITLRVVLDESSPYPSSQYPSRPPAFYIESNDVPSYMRLHLHASLLKEFRSEERGDLRSILEQGQGGAILSMVEFLEQTLPETIANPPDIGRVTDHLVPRPDEAPSQEQTKRKVTTKKNDRVKRKIVTQDDHDRAKNRQKRMKEDPEWESMLKVRQSLPAWKTRDTITNALDKSRVLVVVGEVRDFAHLKSFLTDNRLDVVKGKFAVPRSTGPDR